MTTKTNRKLHQELYKIKQKTVTATLKGLVSPGWLNECARVSMHRLDDAHVDVNSRANQIKTHAFDLLLSKFRSE
jgi:hypothetical protein